MRPRPPLRSLLVVLPLSALPLIALPLVALPLVACATPSAAPPRSPSPAAPAPSTAIHVRADEPHLAELRQLTFGGENAEAYWSHDGTQLLYQARRGDGDCDRIYRLPLGPDPLSPGAPPAPIAVSSGQGATTCSYFLPGDRDVLFASTHLGGVACPPRPDHSHGYVWALYDSYDIFRAHVDGSGLTRLTDTPGYDAEATVCPKDGSIVFTSVRNGDIELYRMDADGKNVKRLTSTPGYDGGAFFNRDCTKIVWRASRPHPGAELDEYRRLLASGLVHPSRLELYVADADGSNPTQVTYLDAASFAPYFFPSGKRILFSSNYGDPRGREFDLFAIDVDGSHLERVTHAAGFDGFPIFSPDGKYLAFSSNRATPAGQHDTNVFVARWQDAPPAAADVIPTGADAAIRDVAWLADPAREGRGVGTAGLGAARDYIAKRFAELGLEPAGDAGGFTQRFPVTTRLTVGAATSLSLGGTSVPTASVAPLGFSSSGEVKGRLVLAGYGVVSKELGLDDYARLDVKGKVVLVRRFAPELPAAGEKSTELARRLGDLRQKAWTAREHRAAGLVVVDWPLAPAGAPKGWQAPGEAHLPSTPEPDGYGDAGIPVVMTTRSAVAAILPKLARGGAVEAHLTVTLTPEKTDAENVVGRVRAGAPDGERQPGVIVVGAHYDHLGMGGRYSLAPDHHEPHLGADDNASGVAAILDVARALVSHRERLSRDVIVVAFSAEESGVLGSTWFTRHPAPVVGAGGMTDVVAMLNLDMVGRLRGNHLGVLGGDSASEWAELVAPACAAARVDCTTSGDGYGPSDQTPFYAAGVPVLFFFTGPHADYHKPSDDAAHINAAGIARIAGIAASLVETVAARPGRLSYRSMPAPAPRGDQRSFNASLGTIPDYAGPPGGQKGVLLAGVRVGGAAEKAGMKRGDILVRLGEHAIGSVEDLMYALNASKPGQTVKAVVLRDGAEVRLDATFQEGHH